MPDRSQIYSANKIKKTYFSDFTNNFTKNPVTGFLATVTNEEDAKKLLKNLILTNQGERFFQPRVGSNIYNSLFEPLDSITAGSIQDAIIESVRNNLPFIILNSVNVNPNQRNNSFEVSINFSLTNLGNNTDLVLILKRVR